MFYYIMFLIRMKTSFDKNKSNNNCHAGHRKRLYETLKACNFNPVQSHVMLEYILFQVYPMCDTNPIAHRLINKFGSFSNVFDAKIEDLMKVEGVGENAAKKILSYTHFMNYYIMHKTTSKIKLQNPIDFVNYFGEKIRKQKTESLVVVALNDNFETQNFEFFEGDKTDCIDFDVHQIYEVARKYDCYRIVLLHNHPSDNAMPSPADIKNTKTLYEQLIALRVELDDHIIVSENSFYSFDKHDILNDVRELYGRIEFKTHKIIKK